MRSIKSPLPITAPCERENNCVFIITVDSVQMCFLNSTCDTFIYPLWHLEPMPFTSFPAVQGKSVGNLLFFFSNWFSYSGFFKSNLNNTSSLWEKGDSIKGKLFRTLPLRSSHSLPFGTDKGGGIRKNEIFFIPIFLRKIQGMSGRRKDQNIHLFTFIRKCL